MTLTTSATNAPNVTNSPWAKLIRPMVPKIRERPSAASAIMSPKWMPL